MNTTITKENIVDTIQELSDDVTVEQATEELILLHKSGEAIHPNKCVIMVRKRKKKFDALKMKRQLSKHFSDEFFNKEGTFSYRKFKKAEKALNFSEKNN